MQVPSNNGGEIDIETFTNEEKKEQVHVLDFRTSEASLRQVTEARMASTSLTTTDPRDEVKEAVAMMITHSKLDGSDEQILVALVGGNDDTPVPYTLMMDILMGLYGGDRNRVNVAMYVITELLPGDDE